MEQLKRGIDDLGSSSSDEFALKKRKTMVDEFDVDDARIVSKYKDPPRHWRDIPQRILRDKLRVTEFQLFFKSRGETDRGKSIRCLDDIEEKVTEDEMDQFNNMDWTFSTLNSDQNLTLYQRLTLLGPDWDIPCQFSLSTYKSDKIYDKFYANIQEKVTSGMSESEVREVVEALHKTHYPEVVPIGVSAACQDWIRRIKWRNEVNERMDLVLRLWDEVKKKKRKFSDVLQEIYEEHDVKYSNRNTGDFLKIVFDDLQAYVNQHSANGDDIDDAVKEGYINKYISAYEMIHTLYADYAKKKMQLGEQLGIVYE